MRSITRASLSLFVASLVSSAPSAASAANLFRGGDVGYTSTGGSTASNPYLPKKQNRIIGGWEAEEDRFPYSVSIQDSGGHFCGGSMIGKDSVLTAAHCIDDGGTVIVVIGSDDVDVGEKIRARKLEVHPDYDSDTDQNDYGIIFLEESTTLDIPFVKINSDPDFPAVNTIAHTVGWGDVDPDEDKQELVDILREVDVKVISNEDCASKEKDGISYGDWVYDDMLCTDTPGQDACQGDSGGPLVIKGNNAEEDVLVGIVSWGYGCAYLPGVFARTSYEYEWIRTTTCDEAQDFSPLCGTPAPTDNPTEPPTPPPTRTPTEEPTNDPTKKPTNAPTNQPTKKPTQSPTKRPTNTPTTPPTISPSYSPSKSPTLSPSLSPTTAKPTKSPTTSPTSMPSLSMAPTGSPSSSPTISAQPTSHPTESPSVSLSPTGAPSSIPTASSHPTEAPSQSQSPSMGPTLVPTVSHQPTVSVEPTSAPTSQPSNSPSISNPPSEEPSGVPSMAPSDSPTITFSPTVTIRPTISAAPVLSKPTEGDREGDVPANALLFTDLSVVAERGGDTPEAKADISSAGMGGGSVVGTLLCGIVSVWMML